MEFSNHYTPLPLPELAAWLHGEYIATGNFELQQAADLLMEQAAKIKKLQKNVEDTTKQYIKSEIDATNLTGEIATIYAEKQRLEEYIRYKHDEYAHGHPIYPDKAAATKDIIDHFPDSAAARERDEQELDAVWTTIAAQGEQLADLEAERDHYMACSFEWQEKYQKMKRRLLTIAEWAGNLAHRHYMPACFPFQLEDGFAVVKLVAIADDERGYGDVYNNLTDAKAAHPDPCTKFLFGYGVVGPDGYSPDDCDEFHESLAKAIEAYDLWRAEKDDWNKEEE